MFIRDDEKRTARKTHERRRICSFHFEFKDKVEKSRNFDDKVDLLKDEISGKKKRNFENKAEISRIKSTY